MLDRVVHIIAFGDLEAEDVLQLTELNFMKVFRLAQLIIEYLLYVQDTLASDCSRLRHERSDLLNQLVNKYKTGDSLAVD